jgi:hypothetical protein
MQAKRPFMPLVGVRPQQIDSNSKIAKHGGDESTPLIGGRSYQFGPV